MNTATLDRQQTDRPQTDRPQTEFATITVQYLNEKKAGQRNASIKDVDGVYYWVKPEDLHDYVEGGSYEIGFITTQSNGYTNRTIKSMQPVAQQRQPSAPQRAQPAQAARAPVRQSAPVEQPRPEPQRPVPQQNGNGNQYYRQTAPQDARRMFLTATLGHFIETGRVEGKAQSIADAMVEILAAYDSVIGQEDRP